MRILKEFLGEGTGRLMEFWGLRVLWLFKGRWPLQSLLFGVGQLGWNTSSSSVSMLSILHSGTRHFLSPSCDRRRFQLLLRLPELRDRRRQGERQGEGRGDILGERRGESRGDARILEFVEEDLTDRVLISTGG